MPLLQLQVINLCAINIQPLKRKITNNGYAYKFTFEVIPWNLINEIIPVHTNDR